MKLIKNASGQYSIRMSRADWEAIGKQAKWTPPWLDKKEKGGCSCKCSDGKECKCNSDCSKCSCKKEAAAKDGLKTETSISK